MFIGSDPRRSSTMTRTRNRELGGPISHRMEPTRQPRITRAACHLRPPYTAESRAKSPPERDSGLFRQDIGDFAKLGAGTQQIEAFDRKMIGQEQPVGPAVDDHERLQR